MFYLFIWFTKILNCFDIEDMYWSDDFNCLIKKIKINALFFFYKRYFISQEHVQHAFFFV